MKPAYSREASFGAGARTHRQSAPLVDRSLSSKMLAVLSFVFAIWFIVPSLQAAFPKRSTNGSNSFGPLRFMRDGTFQIAIFEDLHFGESTCLFGSKILRTWN